MPPHSFPLTRAAVAACAVLALAVVAGAPAGAAAPAAFGAKQKTKKKSSKKASEQTVATVSGVFTVRKNFEGGFGADNGEYWEQMVVTIKKAKIPYHGDNGFSSSAKAKVTFEYTAKAHTDDRSYHAGCDTEEHNTTGSWEGETQVTIAPAKRWRTAGKESYKGGWSVSAEAPDDMKLTSTGYFQDWDSILMTNCITTNDTSLPGAWTWGFANPTGFGTGLSSDNKAVVISHADTEADEVGSATGGISFSAAVHR